MATPDSIMSMTKHGVFVWSSYGIAALVLIALVVLSIRALRRTEADLAEAERTARDRRNEA